MSHSPSNRLIDWTAILLLTTTILCVVSCVLVPEYFFAKLERAKDWTVLMAAVLALFSLCVPFFISVLSVVQCLRRNLSRNRRLARVMVAYFCNLLAFAGVYYELVAFGDMFDASERYTFYHDVYERNVPIYRALYGIDPPPMKSTRAFNGMSARLVTGVDWKEGFNESELDWDLLPTSYFLKEAKFRQEDVVKFIPSARWPVWFDCLHYSVVTSATVGYGDITPNSRWAKVVTDIQIGESIILTVVVVGMLFGGWWPSNSLDQTGMRG